MRTRMYGGVGGGKGDRPPYPDSIRKAAPSRARVVALPKLGSAWAIEVRIFTVAGVIVHVIGC